MGQISVEIRRLSGSVLRGNQHLHRVVETPDVYRLVVTWERVEDHLDIFRASEGFQVWRALASPFFAKPPKVTHSHEVALA